MDNASKNEAERQRLIHRLLYEDPNGCHSDEDAILEFGRVWTLTELRESLRQITGTD